jgi:hypothetical protein
MTHTDQARQEQFPGQAVADMAPTISGPLMLRDAGEHLRLAGGDG